MKSKMFTIVGGSLLLAGLSGCTHVTKPDAHLVSPYPPREKIAMSVGLMLNDTIRDYTWEMKFMGDTWQVPLGENLVLNTTNLAQTLFQSVQVQNEQSIGSQDVDAILVPSVAFIEQTTGVWAGSDGILSMSLEWTLKDSSGNPIWIETVSGSATNNMGSAFTYGKRQRERVYMTLDELFQKSHEAIAQSPEIKAHENGIRATAP